MEELKPCPFCGSKAPHFLVVDRTFLDWLFRVPPLHRVWCPGCLAFPWGRESTSELAALWNRRPEK